MNNLSDEEMEKIADLVVSKMETRLYTNVGYGVLGFVWKGVVMAIIALAAYGALGHWWGK